jgi:hypothetical protein
VPSFVFLLLLYILSFESIHAHKGDLTGRIDNFPFSSAALFSLNALSLSLSLERCDVFYLLIYDLVSVLRFSPLSLSLVLCAFLKTSEESEKGSKCETHKEISMKLFSSYNNAILVKGD